MAGVDDLLVWKELGVGAVGMMVFYKFATTVTNNAAKQMEQLHTSFLEAYKDNTKTLTELVAEFKDHNRTKDRALEMLEENQKKLEEKYESLRKSHE